jgi:hypothetical protein
MDFITFPGFVVVVMASFLIFMVSISIEDAVKHRRK